MGHQNSNRPVISKRMLKAKKVLNAIYSGERVATHVQLKKGKVSLEKSANKVLNAIYSGERVVTHVQLQ